MRKFEGLRSLCMMFAECRKFKQHNMLYIKIIKLSLEFFNWSLSSKIFFKSYAHTSIIINKDLKLFISFISFSGITMSISCGVKILLGIMENYLMMDNSRQTYFIWLRSVISHSINLTATIFLVSLLLALTTYPPTPSPSICSSLYFSLISFHAFPSLFIFVLL